MFAFDEMVAALNELKTATRCGKNFLANKGDSFGVGINSFAKALEPLRRINRVAHYCIVYSVRRTDVADNHRAHMDAHTDTNGLKSLGNAAFVVCR